ncbi:MAG TPA: DNA-3-methyladenine glycosylase [Clostridiales bacterium]|nr:DNA-3-methyladenine glycosylase [Clostridiales bacterium]
MKLGPDFFQRDCLEVGPDLVGKILVRRLPDGNEIRLRITETECYRGEEDTACHARFGRTKRASVLYRESGTIYVYLCYGINWLLNIVTGEVDLPQAVLIRACEGFPGPGRLTKRLEIDGQFNEICINSCPDFWIEDDGQRFLIIPDKRVGIDYASEEDRNRLWRFKAGKRL